MHAGGVPQYSTYTPTSFASQSHHITRKCEMPQFSLTYDSEANGFECYLPDRTVHAPLAPSHPIDMVSVSVGSQNGNLLRLAYSSRSDDGARVIVIVHVDALTGKLVDAPSVSETIDAETAAAFMEAAAETVNPAGALRDLIDFRPEQLPQGEPVVAFAHGE